MLLKYKVRGNGVQPLKMTLRLFPFVLGTYPGPVLCILRPWYSVVIDNGYNPDDFEQKLMQTYRKNGFATWYQRRDRYDEISVMGRLLEPVLQISDGEDENGDELICEGPKGSKAAE